MKKSQAVQLPVYSLTRTDHFCQTPEVRAGEFQNLTGVPHIGIHTYIYRLVGRRTVYARGENKANFSTNEKIPSCKVALPLTRFAIGVSVSPRIGLTTTLVAIHLYPQALAYVRT